MNKPAEDPNVSEMEKQTISEASHQTPDATADDPPPKTHRQVRPSMKLHFRSLNYLLSLEG